MRRIALTGGIATGKSYVRRQFEVLGVPTIDADVLARESVAPGTPGLDAVIRRFGAGILDSTGALDRPALASLVFSDPKARHDLEAIVHPFVRAATDRWFDSLSSDRQPFAIADIPLLYEVGRDKDFDAVIVAACAPEIQLRRLMARDSLSEEEARKRLSAQLPIEEKVRRGEYVVRTDGTHEETNRQVKELYERLSGARRA
jgi:dephospho-CoA kinase